MTNKTRQMAEDLKRYHQAFADMSLTDLEEMIFDWESLLMPDGTSATAVQVRQICVHDAWYFIPPRAKTPMHPDRIEVTEEQKKQLAVILRQEWPVCLDCFTVRADQGT